MQTTEVRKKIFGISYGLVMDGEVGGPARGSGVEDS